MSSHGLATTQRLAAAGIVVAALQTGCAAVADPAATATATRAATAAAMSSPTTSLPAETPAPNVQAGVPSEQGVFVGSWSSAPGMPSINVVHGWVLHIETSAGEPVEGAIVAVNGDMPAHGHGMPTQPQVTADLGGGDYQIEGMSFQMGGYWVVDVTVSAGGQTDLIRFGLDL